MTKEEILKLTHDLYRLTLLFPKKEPLKYKIREIGIEILADLTKWIEKIDFKWFQFLLVLLFIVGVVLLNQAYSWVPF